MTYRSGDCSLRWPTPNVRSALRIQQRAEFATRYKIDSREAKTARPIQRRNVVAVDADPTPIDAASVAAPLICVARAAALLGLGRASPHGLRHAGKFDPAGVNALATEFQEVTGA
jgi:hypothetical protein